jgi:hypothetical protein
MSTSVHEPTSRPYFAKKSAWARHRAAELQRQANEMRYDPSTSSMKAAQKYACVRNLEKEASRMETIARRLEEKGQ